MLPTQREALNTNVVELEAARQAKTACLLASSRVLHEGLVSDTTIHIVAGGAATGGPAMSWAAAETGYQAAVAGGAACSHVCTRLQEA